MLHGGVVIKACREARELTQEELSNQYGISITTLGKWEREVTEPSFMTVFEICRHLGFTIIEVYNYVHDRNLPDNQSSKKRVA